MAVLNLQRSQGKIRIVTALLIILTTTDSLASIMYAAGVGARPPLDECVARSPSQRDKPTTAAVIRTPHDIR
jgi:hypothetical protein